MGDSIAAVFLFAIISSKQQHRALACQAGLGLTHWQPGWADAMWGVTTALNEHKRKVLRQAAAQVPFCEFPLVKMTCTAVNHLSVGVAITHRVLCHTAGCTASGWLVGHTLRRGDAASRVDRDFPETVVLRNTILVVF